MSADLTILELAEVANDLGSTIYFVRTLIAARELKFLKVGKKFKVTREALDQWKRTAQGYPGEADAPRTKRKERENRKVAEIGASKASAIS